MPKLLNYVTDCLAEEKSQKVFFYCYITFFCLIAFYNAFTASLGFFMDTIEHIQSSWLVSQGKVPYRDFFQHHHPLLWFLFAPVTKFFYQDLIIFTVARSIGVAGYMVSIWILYKINCRFIYGSKIAKLSLLILLSVPFLWTDITTFRPDIFMHICFLGSLYYFFAYCKNMKTLTLALSYFLQALSALFLQKILLLSFCFFLLNLYYLYRKKICWKHFIIAGFFYIIPWLFFFYFLSINNLFADWYYYNFKFNFLMREYFADYTNGYTFVLPFATIFSFFLILHYFDKNENQEILFFLYLFSLLSIMIFAPHQQYYTLSWYFASVFLGNILYRIKYFKYIYLLLLIAAYANIYLLMPSYNNKEAYQSYLKNIDYLWKQKISEDDFLSLTKTIYSPFIPNSSYYWFGFHNVVIIDTIYNKQRYFDLKNELENKKPQFIAFERRSFTGSLDDMIVYNKRKYFIRRNSAILQKALEHTEFLSKLIVIDCDFWKIDEEWIERHYTQLSGLTIWRRKDITSKQNENPV